ncbi:MULTISPECIES: tyrosine-type recombinase/integrase [Burkholderiaceae]|jgi:integrase/recombinase XerD|uniref:Integrase n=1 Tax=Paraburkholderia fungorum TaxID=134537 RepID=A0AAW3V5S8_9BURK|nr:MULTISPECIES: tyrosine-type recombinase/integrase [Pseudomonadota]AJZ56136.1 phage integrase family protein [Paraburkholderia fungorum]KHS13951.1 integrase [Burkholderia multivorans]MBB4519926.1 integrase [Paraburkholderia fungorum]MBB5546773.1 integrase [Paraburkholderia fungorum]MBB6205212.1 integrase [Paraburkholderia fungorum]
MRLLVSTKDLVIGGKAYAGFPILLWDSMESCTEANEFLRHYLLRGSIGSRKSWEPVGRALYDYFSFLQAHDLEWDDVDRGEQKTLLAAYRDYCFETAGHKRSTVRNRLLYVCEFYSFAHAKGWLKNLPFGYETRRVFRSAGFLAHVDGTGGAKAVRDVMPKAHKDLPGYLTSSEVQALLASATNPHHRMLIRLALGSGLRREELATFPRAYVFDPDLAGRTERNIRVHLDPEDGHGIRTKGNKPRTIYIGRRLMKDLNQYAIHERGLRSSLSRFPEKALFLNQFGDRFAADGKSVDRIVREAGESARVRAWTHLLRHTYATHTLVALQRSRDRYRIEPLVFLQRQLGHASVQTTMVYLHLVNELADDAVLTYDDELNDLADKLNGQTEDLHQD